MKIRVKIAILTQRENERPGYYTEEDVYSQTLEGAESDIRRIIDVVNQTEQPGSLTP